MDRIDFTIIRALQEDGRLSNFQLAERVGLSPSPCLRRLRILEDAGIIRGYSAVVDQKKFGLPVTAFIRIKLQVHAGEAVSAFEAAIKALDNVLECYLLSGTSDYLLRVIVADLEDYDRFLRNSIHSISGIASIDSSFAYSEIKKTTVFRSN